MRIRAKTAPLLLAYCLLAICTSVMASATSGGLLSQDVSEDSMISGGRSGLPIVDQLLSKVGSLGDYKFDALQNTVEGSKVAVASGTFWVKNPNAVRVDVKDYGIKSGSILIRQADGTIKAQGGPAMWGIKMTLEPSSRLLKLPNGFSAVDCDIASLLPRLKKLSSAGAKIVASDSPIKVQSLNNKVLVLESQTQNGADTEISDRVFVDPVQNVPLQWDLFKNGKFYSRTRFQNYQFNGHWDASQFKLD